MFSACDPDAVQYTWSVPKVMRMIFCAVQKGQERKMGIEAGGGGTQV